MDFGIILKLMRRDHMNTEAIRIRYREEQTTKFRVEEEQELSILEKLVLTTK